MDGAYVDVLPVVGRDNVRELVGVISLPDTLRAYGIENAPNCP
jgi:CBS domain-containing protein